jgi:hypothetical protein
MPRAELKGLNKGNERHIQTRAKCHATFLQCQLRLATKYSLHSDRCRGGIKITRILVSMNGFVSYHKSPSIAITTKNIAVNQQLTRIETGGMIFKPV